MFHAKESSWRRKRRNAILKITNLQGLKYKFCSSFLEAVTFTSDVEQRKQSSRNIGAYQDIGDNTEITSHVLTGRGNPKHLIRRNIFARAQQVSHALGI